MAVESPPTLFWTSKQPSRIAEVMDEAEQRPAGKCFSSFPNLRLWIVEHVWAHKTTALHQVLDLLMLPEMDLQPVSLEDPWRLRVASAQVYSTVKNRDVKNFDRVIGFLENVYRLLPRLVAPIKHMKIVFGLKTMLIMWMLRERRGMVDTMLKINRFFPRKLPQYQSQCSRRDLFLMIQNHLDFRSVAQALTMDRAKLEDYIKNEMEEQYGEHYAQKVEDRLLHYLNQLETKLPGKTHIDKILDKGRPATEEERLLVDVVTADSASIGSTLKTLLQCDDVSCSLDSTAQSPEHGTNEAEDAPRSKVLLQTAPASFPDVGVGNEEGLGEVTAPPQFCSKHRQWVETILQHCSDEPQELSPAAASPLLFLSSSSFCTSSSNSSSSPSGSSSDDLTPSQLIPQHTPAQTSRCVGEHTPPEEKPSCGSMDEAPQASTSQNEKTLAVYLADIDPTEGTRDLFAPRPASPHDVHINQRTVRNSKKRSAVCPENRHVQALEGDGFEVPSSGFTAGCASSGGSVGCSRPHVPTWTSESLVFFPECSAHQVSPSGDSSRSSGGSRRRPQRVAALQSPPGTDASRSSGSTDGTGTCESSGVQRPQLKLSLRCQAALLQSRLFQPYVSLTRLSSHVRSSQPAGPQAEDPCSFDPNTLYSSYSSSSGGDDSLVYDPDYKPNITRKRMLLEYEAARNPI